MRKPSLLLLAVLMIGILIFSTVPALALDLGFTYTGTPPSGSGPWLTAFFDDGGGSGSVDLTLTSHLTNADEFFFKVLLNFDPQLSVSYDSSSFTVLSGDVDVPTVGIGQDSFAAEGDGYFDISINFAQRGNQDRFDNSDIIKLTFTGTGITADSFLDFNSTPKNTGNDLSFPIVAKVGGIPTGECTGSGNITVPEPATLILLGFGLTGLGLLGRRKSRSS